MHNYVKFVFVEEMLKFMLFVLHPLVTNWQKCELSPLVFTLKHTVVLGRLEELKQHYISSFPNFHHKCYKHL